MDFGELIEAFSKKVGVEGLVPDEEGVCCIAVDDMTVTVRAFPELDKILTYAEVGDAPVEGAETFYGTMLGANHMFQGTGGAALSQDPETKKLFLNRYDALGTMDPDAFSQMLEKFINVLETWRKLLADYRPAVAEETGGGALPGLGGFMQV